MMVAVRRWTAGVSLAGGTAVAAAMVGASIAHADVIDEFLLQAEDNLSATASLFSGLDSSSLPSDAGFISSLESEGALISQIQAQQDTFSDALQSSSQLVNADQQLADASGELVSSSQTLVNAINAGDLPLSVTESFSDKVTGLEAAFGFLNADLLQLLPAEINAAFVTIADGGTLDFASIDPGLAAEAVPPIVTSYPFELLNDASSDFTQATAVLDGIPPADVVSVLTPQLAIQDTSLQALSTLDSAQNTIDAYDNGALADLATPWFNSVDGGWAQSAEALLNADQALDAALTAGSGVQAAELTVLAADLGIFGDIANSVGIGFAAALF
jgi:hypothetical protein